LVRFTVVTRCNLKNKLYIDQTQARKWKLQ
jgi:hypothetical protein